MIEGLWPVLMGLYTHDRIADIKLFVFFRYLVTFSPQQDHRAESAHAIIVWEVFSGQKKRTFHADMTGEDDRQWPIFK